MHDSTKRFSTRVENYVKYRPSYPAEIVTLLEHECGLTVESRIADIGSGTGILTQLFLENGNPVWGVEPNREMREAAERMLSRYERFTSVDGTAEETTLPSSGVDFITAGQAFHWFDRSRARLEWQRILRPAGWVVLIWNERRTQSSAFQSTYERMLQTFGTDYREVTHKNVDEEIAGAFFGPAGFQRQTLANQQVFDWEGLHGRLLSSSYAPEPGHPDYQAMRDELRRIFDAHQQTGRVVFEYDTRVYWGRLS